MKPKNLKLYKGLAIVAGGIVFSNVFSVAFHKSVSGDLPFEDIYEHKVYSSEITKNGTINDEYYASQLDYNEAIIIKSPYNYNQDKKQYERKVGMISANDYSINEINFITENIENQNLLFEQEYIYKMTDSLRNSKDFEISNSFSKDNNYEISYITFTENFEDTKKSELMIVSDLIEYLIGNGLGIVTYSTIGICISFIKDSIESKKENKTKKLSMK